MANVEAKWSPATPPVRVEYGPRTVDEVGGGQASSSGLYKELVYEFNYDGMPAYNAGTGLEATIPPGSVVTAVAVQDVDGALAGNFIMDLNDGGVAINVVTTVAVPSGVGAWLNCTVEATAISGTRTVETVITGLTAGRAKVVVTYLDSQNRPGK